MVSPAFPGGKQVDIAPLETIDFSRLAVKDSAEISKLLKSCQTHGFFYLDLQNDDAGRQLLQDEKDVLKVMEEYFAQPFEVKMKDDRNSVLHGYKPVGTFSGVTHGSRDCYETLKVARAEMVAKSPNLPEAAKQNLELFDSYISLSHTITHTLLACLSDALNLPTQQRLENSHRDGEPTNTTLVMLSYPPNTDDGHIGHNKHTDIGSITLLFSNQWGLQVVTPENKEWQFIQPRPGYATINVGDSLRFLSGKQLMSCLHRVIPVDPSEHRYSIAYFLRPESALVFKDPEEKPITAEEWHDQKYVMFGESHETQAESKMLTGGVEQILVGA